eukprot:scaffold15144_cov48-Attheya_sp.AAC.1
MNDMTDPAFPTDGRMLVAAANDDPQGGTAASRSVIANPYLRPRVIEPPAPPRQATIGTSGNIIVPPPGSIENAYGIRATSHAQEPIEQPLVEEDTVPTATVNRDFGRKTHHLGMGK